MSTESSQDQVVQPHAADAVANADERSGWFKGGWLNAAGLALMLVAVLWSYHAFAVQDPYVSGVLQLTGNQQRGEEIFVMNCATCHGLEAGGEVGPDLSRVSERKSRKALIEQVISGKTPPMPQFQPNERDMADLLSFLETL